MLYSMPGQLVADFFRGSGTIHVAAIQCGRNFVGSDLYYEDIAQERAAAARLDTSTPFSGVTPKSLEFWVRELNGDPTKAPRPASTASRRRSMTKATARSASNSLRIWATAQRDAAVRITKSRGLEVGLLYRERNICLGIIAHVFGTNA